MKLAHYCDIVIRWSFYILLFFVPLFFTGNTSELFELNKMWLTWGLSVIIIGAWISKMTVERKIFIQRTPLDIPIILFLLSQLISTIFSLDQRVSFWGYYSRFNGGFLSLLTYTLLYYAFVSNSTLQQAKRYLYVTIIGGIFVALWGLPSHFGYDPTCLMFRGTLDTSCWTEAFRPTIRIFSSLGQPAWMAAYLAVLLPLTMAAFIWEKEKTQVKSFILSLKNYKVFGLLLLSVLFYFDLLYTDTRAGFLGFWAANALFWATLFIIRIIQIKRFVQYFLLFNLIFLIASFISGVPIAQLSRFSLKSLSTKTVSQPTQAPTAAPTAPQATAQDTTTGITDSGQIRLHVWKGAIDAWKAHPIFGTGVETFAFAYYQFRPAGHNMTSEWDYLYNKAHNEYLNYLTTTGIFGLGTHIAILVLFIFLAALKLFKARNEKNDTPDLQRLLFAAAIPASFVSIIITNFFGFSVVIINVFLYLLPAWFFILTAMLSPEKGYLLSFQSSNKNKVAAINSYQWTILTVTGFVGLIFLFQLFRFWQADVDYALGYNLDHAGDYQSAYPKLANAIQTRKAEPVFKDEFSTNLATLATALLQNKDQSGAQLAQQAITISDEVVNNHPNNVVFWKSRVRVFYLLAQIDPKYYQQALDAILHAKQLAPTDAKISYNVGVLYGQNNQIQRGIDELTNTIKLKPDYRDAYYARAIFYHQLSEESSGQQKTAYQEKAVADLRYILKNFAEDPEVKKTLASWGVPVE